MESSLKSALLVNLKGHLFAICGSIDHAATLGISAWIIVTLTHWHDGIEIPTELALAIQRNSENKRHT